MDERLKAFSRKAAELAAAPGRDSPPVAQRHIDRFHEVKDAFRGGSWTVGLDGGWRLEIECDGFSATCHLAIDGLDECWSHYDISTSEECREAALKLLERAERAGFVPPSQAVTVSAIADGSVENGLDAVRAVRRR